MCVDEVAGIEELPSTARVPLSRRAKVLWPDLVLGVLRTSWGLAAELDLTLLPVLTGASSDPTAALIGLE